MVGGALQRHLIKYRCAIISQRRGSSEMRGWNRADRCQRQTGLARIPPPPPPRLHDNRGVLESRGGGQRKSIRPDTVAWTSARNGRNSLP